MFIRCSVWREYGENVAESLAKGMRVVVTGRLTVRTYDYNGQQRTSLEMQVDEIGPSLRYARAQVTRTPSQTHHTTVSNPNTAQTYTDPAGNLTTLQPPF